MDNSAGSRLKLDDFVHLDNLIRCFLVAAVVAVASKSAAMWNKASKWDDSKDVRRQTFFQNEMRFTN